MKLTKKLEAEIKALMDDYWNSYFRGDLKHWRNYLVDDYRNIGGTEEEIWNSKKEILDYTKRVIDQMIGQAEIRNKKTQIIPYDPYIMVHEFMDLFIKLEGKWNFYGKFRLSSLIQKIAGEWKVLHQHGSYPDSHTEEGEAFAFDKLRKENTQLRDAVKRRTVELENKNRELEIETALERVRTVAMGMKQPKDMIGICRIISKQLQLLKIQNIRNVQTAIINDKKGTYLNYEYFTQYKTTSVLEVVTKLHPKVQEFATTIKKSADAFFTTSFKGAALKKWRDYRKKTGQNADPILDKAKSLHYYFYSIGPGALGLSTYAPLSDEEINIFHRFRNVFNLAYQRFIDIQKAEAQVREVQIEASLEKVRAQAMGMHKPDDLLNVCKVLFKELLHLGFDQLRNALIHTFYDEKNYFRDHDYSDVNGGVITTIPYSEPIIKRFLKEIRKSDKAFSHMTVTGDELKEWKKFRKKGVQKDDPRLAKASSLYYYVYSIGIGSIGISTFKAITEDQQQVLKRFRNVFDFAYRRYMDVAKAEEQAREARIETALERVRAVAMAMKKSEELVSVCEVMYKELLSLGFDNIRNAQIGIQNNEKQVYSFYVYSDFEKITGGEVAYDSSPIMQRVHKELGGSGDGLYERKYSSAEMEEWRRFRKGLSPFNDPREKIATSLCWYLYAIGKGNIGISTFNVITEEQIEIVKRFKNVFDLSYRRFDDLQKAEAQSREGQIQLALERVRARTMAMHHSDELTDVVKLLYQEFDKLKISNESTDIEIGLIDEETGIASIWAHFYLSDGTISTFKFPVTHFDEVRKEFEEWKATPVEKRSELFFTLELSGERWQNFVDRAVQLPEISEIFKPLIEAKISKWVTHNAYFSHGCLTLQGTEAYSVETQEIQKRFAKVFEQTYTRFLDLQKAEAQAREAQIEASLERVRSRAMAMQTSEELNALIGTVFTELTKLDLVLTRCVIIIYDPVTNGARWWMANSEAPDQPMNFFVKHHALPFFTAYLDAWKERTIKWQYILEGQNKITTDDFLFTETELSQLPGFVIAGMRAPGRVYLNSSFNNFGNLTLASIEPLSGEHFDILLRFAKVFDLTYTRFNDLKQAEAQAREAKIEVAVERVRAKALAMHKSEEIINVVNTLRNELVGLNIPGVAAATISLQQENGRIRLWDITSVVELEDGFHFSMDIVFSLDETDPDYWIRKIWDGDKKYFVIEQDEKSIKKTVIWTRKYNPEFADNAQQFLEANGIKHVWHPVVQLSHGKLSLDLLQQPGAEVEPILTKMGAAFDLAYKRFLDLKNAEAQTREAQIELALERVRTRAMTMHHSDELSEVLSVLFDQFDILGIYPSHATISLIDVEKNSFIFRMTGKAGKRVMAQQVISLDALNMWKNTAELLKNLGTISVYCNEYPKEVLPKLWELVSEVISAIPEDARPYPEDFPNGMYEAVGIYRLRGDTAYGTISFCHNRKATEEEKDIVGRFATEFGRLYQRFLDLQKAEAQARQARIEAAMEKVRSRAMAMQKPNELVDVAELLRREMGLLGVEELETSSIYLHREDIQKTECWYAIKDVQHTEKELVSDHMIIDLDETTVGRQMLAFYRSGKKHISIPMQGDARKEWINYCADHSKVLVGFYGDNIPDRTYHLYKFSGGYMGAASPGDISAESWDLLQRATSVFSLAYTRFSDLQQAEAQAREAKIEASLEKVRARTMGMQRSEELPQAANLLFQQIQSLGMPAWSAGYCIWDEDKKGITLWMSSEGVLQPPFKAPLTEDPSFIHMRERYERGETFYAEEIGGEDLGRHYKYMRTLPVVGEILDSIIEAGHPLPTFQIFHCAYFSQGFLLFITYEPVPEAHDIFKRFGKVFDQTYTRFLDLQKAEAQAREAEIELSLERIRSKAMAMHGSGDILATTTTAFEELQKLGIHSIRCGIGLLSKNSMEAQVYASATDSNGVFQTLVGIRHMNDHPSLTRQYQSWLKQENFVEALHDEELKSYYNKLFFQSSATTTIPQSFDKKQNGYYFSFPDGLFYSWSDQPYSENEINILIRFNAIVALTFRRFLDLQKAESQAREATIEAALERVRSRAMAMHKSDELLEVITVVSEQLKQLNFKFDNVSFATRNQHHDYKFWLSAAGTPHPYHIHVPWLKNPMFERVRDVQINDHPLYTDTLTIEESRQWHQHVFENSVLKSLPAETKDYILNSGYARTVAFMPTIMMIIGNYLSKPYTEDENNIFKRFAGVFEQSYTRFLDLQKAEAQAREAQIEVSLERVRSKAMAMQKSEDLANAVAIVFEELDKLNLGMLRCGIGILNKEKRNAEVWTTTKSDNDTVVQVSGDESMDIHPLLQGAFDAWLSQEDHSYVLKGEDLNDYYKAVAGTNFKLPDSQSLITGSEGIQQFYFNAVFSSGGLFAFRETEFPEEAKVVLKRFADVFNLTYTRFNDLKQAEAQAREATIEAALERVRGKAMAMHNSNDLSSTASTIFTELRKLGISPIRCGVGLLNKESRKGQLYSATSSAGGDSLSLVGWVELSGHPVLERIYDTWLQNEDYYPELAGEQLGSYYQLLLRGLLVTVPDWQSGDKQYGHFLPFSVGCLYAWSEIPYNDAEIKILKRFATIVDLTFRRYMELQTSEANAREAVKQAALDRVRADIASMRTISDLDRITPLIWNELTILGVPFIRCGVFIMDNAQQLIHTFLSTPDGKAIAAFHLPYDTPGNIREVLSHWRNNKNYIDHWDESAFTEFANILVQQGELSSAEQYLKTIPRGGFYLHFLPFLQGMLYVGNSTQLNEEEIQLIQSVAAAFSTAYARYEDFNRLEAAKQQVEKTLTDLKQAQTQLVQSEKMASLGELTAGIAHEIQNPLNFVNNFSDVSNELIDEMMEEVAKGNFNEAKAIADDVKQNLEKISHHGKRADGIVKGMLQHSRTSSGQKEMTDINALADEYLRLAYHGLRAKDKSFNAKFETDFDPSLDKINIMPQDIGRVILNMINNAFYAVTEKRKKAEAGYEPIVAISTRRINANIEIRIKDNGIGISPRVMDKIFQPFFTTKPTGQGTGLGLSLAYDIVKTHGGELKVETKEGEGSHFIIQLPTN